MGKNPITLEPDPEESEEMAPGMRPSEMPPEEKEVKNVGQRHKEYR